MPRRSGDGSKRPARGRLPELLSTASASLPPSQDWSPEDVAHARALEPQEGTWLGARVPLDLSIQDIGAVDLCVWMDGSTHVVRAFNLVPSSSPEGEPARLLRLALLQPVSEASGVRPSRLAVLPERERAPLEDVMGLLGMEWATHADFSPVERMVRGFLEQRRAANGATTGDEAAAEVVTAFRGALAGLLSAAPWRYMGGDDLVRVVGLQPEPIYVSLDVRGDRGPQFSFFLGREAALAPFEGGATDDRPRVPVLVVYFVRPDMCGPYMRKEMQSGDWPLAREQGYPVALRLDRDPPHHVADTNELRLLTLLVGWLSVLPFEGREPFEASLPLGPEVRLVATWPLSPGAVRSDAAPPPRVRTRAPRKRASAHPEPSGDVAPSPPKKGRSRARKTEPPTPD